MSITGSNGCGGAGRRPESALGGIPRGWRRRSVNTDEKFGAGCVKGGAGWGRRPEGALRGIPRGWRSRTGRLWVRSGWLPPRGLWVRQLLRDENMEIDNR